MKKNICMQALAAVALTGLLASTAQAQAECASAVCWNTAAKADLLETSQLATLSEQVRKLTAELEAARNRRVERLAYLGRMDKGLEAVREVVRTKFADTMPAKDELAQLTHAQMLKVKSLTPVLAETPERLARDARIRELTLQVRDAQNKAAAEFQAAKAGPDAEKATAELFVKMRTEFAQANTELLSLQAAKRAELDALTKGDLMLQAEQAQLKDLISVGEYQDRLSLMASARAALPGDTAAIDALQSKLTQLLQGYLAAGTR